jgi:DNA-binding transcriptional regulator GbsR (MarR family)
MSQPDLFEALSGYAESWGLLFARWGLPRTAGRIWGWLYVCEPPEQSAQELVEALHVSKASVSTNTRLLESMGLVERVGLRGARASHYRLKPGGLEGMLRQRIAGAVEARALTEQGLDALESEGEGRTKRLEEKLDFYRFMEHELEELLRHWQEHRAQRKREGRG